MKILTIFAVILCFTSATSLFASSLRAAAQLVPGTALVDGLSNPSQVVITSRQPLFSWEFASDISSFSVVVSSDNIFSDSGELWNYNGASTDSTNTINFITRVRYNGTVLDVNSTYYWQVTIYDEGASATDGGRFTTIASASASNLTGQKFDLVIDWNNPFNPSQNQITKFLITAKDRDRKLKVRIFTLSGLLVRDWDEQTAIRDAVYTVTWDGKNNNNETVARGIYLVNLMDVGDNAGVTKKVAVINGNQ